MAGEEQEYEEFEDDDTLSMDFQYAEVVVQYGRVYQRYALEENLYYVPADPVCLSIAQELGRAIRKPRAPCHRHAQSLIVLAGRRRTTYYPASCCDQISRR